MGKGKKIWFDIKCFIGFVIGMAVFCFSIIGVSNEPEKFGVMAGMLLSVGIAFVVTMMMLSSSNDAGQGEGEVKDFTEEPMEFLD